MQLVLTGQAGTTNFDFLVISQHGIEVPVVYESYAARAKEGRAAGKQDAQISQDALVAVGLPADMPIYFAVDYSAPEGVSYYRLMQTDFDGIKHYSDTIAVKNTPDKPCVLLTKDGNAYLNCPAQNAWIELYDMQGRLCLQQYYPAGSEMPIDVNGFRSSVFMLRIISESGIQNIKLVK